MQVLRCLYQCELCGDYHSKYRTAKKCCDGDVFAQRFCDNCMEYEEACQCGAILSKEEFKKVEVKAMSVSDFDFDLYRVGDVNVIRWFAGGYEIKIKGEAGD